MGPQLTSHHSFGVPYNNYIYYVGLLDHCPSALAQRGASNRLPARALLMHQKHHTNIAQRHTGANNTMASCAKHDNWQTCTCQMRAFRPQTRGGMHHNLRHKRTHASAPKRAQTCHRGHRECAVCGKGGKGKGGKGVGAGDSPSLLRVSRACPYLILERVVDGFRLSSPFLSGSPVAWPKGERCL